MGYLTINTWSNRVVIISSVITRIFLTLCNAWTVTFQTISIKTLVIYLCVHSTHVPVISYRFIIVVFLFCSVFDFLFTFCLTLFPLNSFAFSSFIALFKEKRFNYDPGLYSRYFDPVQVPVVREVPVHHHLCSSINIIHQAAPTLS
jgi:hypothetical protein